MPEFIGGLPVHPLLVHFTVVLLVLAVGGAVLVAVWPAARRRYGWLVVIAAAVATVLVPFTTNSGDTLATRVQAEGLAEHEQLGNMLLWWALGLTIAVGALMLVHTRAARKTTADAKVAVGAAGAEEVVEPQATKAPAVAMIALALVTVGVAVGAGIHVYRVGDSGARMVWEGVKDLPVRSGG